jgi:hypothetical protein
MEVETLSIEELTLFIEAFPEKSVCERTLKEKLRQYLETRKEEDHGPNQVS